MPDNLALPRHPTADRPLAGVTLLAVEDSRYACEALRLMCLKSGARLRRADCLAAAYRHLAVYRPTVVIVDIGLPDGSGSDLIAKLAQARTPLPLVLGTSGDAGLAAAALAAGADGFLAKPVESLRSFQQTICGGLPQLGSPCTLPEGPSPVHPDPMALRDDLMQAARLLKQAPDRATRAYLARFLGGIARSARDPALAEAADALGPATPGEHALGHLNRLVADRLNATPMF